MKEPFSKYDNAVIGYAQYKNIGSLLPLRYDETVSKRYGVDLIVGSPVISVVVAVNHRTGAYISRDSLFRMHMWSQSVIDKILLFPSFRNNRKRI